MSSIPREHLPGLAWIDRELRTVANRAALHGPGFLPGLAEKLELGEVDPSGALADLHPVEAEAIRRLGLACVREVLRRSDPNA